MARESGQCTTCGSSTRLRALAYLVARAWLGKPAPVPEWPERPDITGIGVGDWPGFKSFYGAKISYINTSFERGAGDDRPFLDVTKPSAGFIGVADFISCSEVLEHVAPPVALAFDGLHAMLKPGGALILTVPYKYRPTLEHFPDLHEWRLETTSVGTKLVNTTRDGALQEFGDLVFHGGESPALEMRVFGLSDLRQQLARAGFIDVEIMNENPYEYGIHWPDPWSRPISARRAPLRA
jgi:SAM-dependent methyltransferase